MHEVSRSQFYVYKRVFQEHGVEGLVDKPSIPASHPNALPEETRDRIIALSLEYPAFSRQRIADQLALEDLIVYPTTVHNVWLKEDLETKYKRLLYLEEKVMPEGFELTENQIRLIEKTNPEFAERHVQSAYPGQLLCQDTFYVCQLKDVGCQQRRIYV